MPGSKWQGTGCFPRSGHKTWVTGSWKSCFPLLALPPTCCETQKSHCLSLSLGFLCHSRNGAYRDALGSLSFSQTDKSSQNLGLGVAGALTWLQSHVGGLLGACRLLADHWAIDLRLLPSAILLDLLTLSSAASGGSRCGQELGSSAHALPTPPAWCPPPPSLVPAPLSLVPAHPPICSGAAG